MSRAALFITLAEIKLTSKLCITVQYGQTYAVAQNTYTVQKKKRNINYQELEVLKSVEMKY